MRGIIIVYALGLAIAWAGSQGSASYAGMPVFALCALLAFALQWLAFVPAYLKQTEKFYDLVGSITYTSCIVLALALSGSIDMRSLLLAICVLIWASRLGAFLFARIHKDGADDRFDKIKPNPVRFFMTWSLQGLWVLITAGAALAAIASDSDAPIGVLACVGVLLWVAGFAIEVIADHQKRVFRGRAGAGEFITEGLWARSRHPNYAGEILLWFGVALIALPALQGWAMATLVSPVFVYLLLSRVSGVPLLEKKADAKWGGQEEYEAYKARTPVLFPRLF
ncbi:DUF1295 domain-containing protein [Halioglobus maricola]|uniref:DUF1295 domain-containing protein n=1 Tax=Halioglobus maricola TaxID=2601894 RepID=A0A5P9NNQ4_9GAMM|nr:DUF1295 domain-containing protein [Halioglobus maricola]QFU77460.1 DUF1295 domain-containing protein [Halioglobus maricola]